MGAGLHHHVSSLSERGSPSRRRRPDAAGGIEANARLTASTGALLLVLLAAEGATIPSVRQLITPHVFIGMILVPPVFLKIASTSYRFVRYYRGAPLYRQKGPPPALLRLLGPFVVVLTLVVLASGIALLLAGSRWRQDLLFVHKVSFVLWFAAMTVHVLGHVRDTARLAPRDWSRRTSYEIGGVGLRQWLLVASVVGGVVVGLLVVSKVGNYIAISSP